MTMNNTFLKRLTAVLLACTVLLVALPTLVLADSQASFNYDTVADPSTSDNYQSMLGTDDDGTRYSGRVWTDKTVLTGDFTENITGATVENDDDFLVVYSALGSSSTIVTTDSGVALDVILVLDNSQSMDGSVSTGGTRLSNMVSATNTLLTNITENEHNRVAIVTYNTVANTILAFDSYSSAVLTSSSSSGVISVSAETTGGSRVSGSSNGYQRGTNQQEGIYQGMKILADQSNENGELDDRVPVLIVLTDGVADSAVASNWWTMDPTSSTGFTKINDNTVTGEIAFSTLLSSAYMKAAVADTYGTAPNVLAIGVDIDAEHSDAAVTMDPSTYVVDDSSSDVGQDAYDFYESWLAGNEPTSTTTIQSSSGSGWPRPGSSSSSSSVTWTFNQLTSNSVGNSYDITLDEVKNYVYYVNTYYDVSSADLETTFQGIYKTITDPAFNPIRSQVQSIQGSADVTYTDPIGEYMEVKEVKSIILFGQEYAVSETGSTTEDGVTTVTYAAGNYTVNHPVYNTPISLANDVKITLVATETDGKLYHELIITIDADALPIRLDGVEDKDGQVTYSSNANTVNSLPLRVCYTVGIQDRIRNSETGMVDLTKVDKDYIADNTEDGKVHAGGPRGSGRSSGSGKPRGSGRSRNSGKPSNR